MNKYVKTFESFNDNKKDGQLIGDYFLSTNEYTSILNNIEYVIDDEEKFDTYLSKLNDYYHNGGVIQRVVFSSKVNKKNLGNHWTHIHNDIDNYIQDLFEFLYEEGKVGENPPITIIEAITPSHNVAIKYSLEQYNTNPWEEEIHIINPKLLSNIKIRCIK